ncbi:MAG: hypothetical protein R3F38_08530 [Gammaproteobacteria bacterium]
MHGETDADARTAEMNSLKRFAMKLTRNSSDADDLLQATLLKLPVTDSFQRGTHVLAGLPAFCTTLCQQQVSPACPL